ncbi:chromate transporter [Pyramidobacter sp. YE332]|uniref:chromate transporter n=1 Tax=Pyramidobacter sp. YE332 TaxID=3068894 RepID=UPI00294B19BD|nr:chromate transporter [Pyramidobacter sp. YE332]WOL40963.1 chromate transporter [Pyramidobacter sp. YE332]
MILLELFLGFLRVGCFAFGGAYGAIPLIRDVALSYGWLTEEALMDMIAVSESTPGPIMVNLATYVGGSRAGFAGALLATLAVVLPSFLVVLLVAAALRGAVKNPYVQFAVRGLKPCVVGMVLATGSVLAVNQCRGKPAAEAGKTALLFAVMGVLIIGYRGVRKKKLPPVMLILASAVLGIFVWS